MDAFKVSTPEHTLLTFHSPIGSGLGKTCHSFQNGTWGLFSVARTEQAWVALAVLRVPLLRAHASRGF